MEGYSLWCLSSEESVASKADYTTDIAGGLGVSDMECWLLKDWSYLKRGDWPTRLLV